VSQRDKVIARIRARPVEADLRDVRALLEEFGWTLDRTRGSHATFVKQGEFPITLSTHGGKVKRTYLTLI
jgi:predicted RNA binding protein YcfA (HicA-like mRNA interferase family)